jgi:drug/metabolite transporter (DMT)-like permease
MDRKDTFDIPVKSCGVVRNTETSSNQVLRRCAEHGNEQQVSTGLVLRLLLVMILWAACFPLITLALPSSPHLTLAAMRAGIAGAALLLIGLFLGRPFPSRMSLWGWIALTGLGTTTFGFLGMVHAAEYVAPGMAAVIANAQPIAAALIAHLFLGERLVTRGYAGLFLGFAGVALIAAQRLLLPDADGYALGIAYLALAALGVAVGNVIMKFLADSMDSIMAIGLQLLLGGVVLAIAAYALEDIGSVQWSPEFGFVLMCLALAVTALPYWLWFSILRRVDLGRANAWTFLVAPFGLVMGFAFFGERPGFLTAGGTGLVVLGIWLAQSAGRPAGDAMRRGNPMPDKERT